MDKGLIELLRQSQTLLDHGDTEELMNSSIWGVALRDITRLIVELRGNNHADIAQQLQSDLDRLESGVEDGLAEESEFRRSAKYRRWSALRRLMSDVEGIVRLAKRSAAFLGDQGPSLNWLTGATNNGLGNSQLKSEVKDLTEALTPVASSHSHAARKAPTRDAKIPDVHSDEVADQFGGPQPDPNDDRVALWLGKRIYLGRDTQLSRLFWLLARPIGRACHLAEVQRAVDGFETSEDIGSDPKEIKQANARLRKALSKLRERLREAKLDDHVMIVRDGGSEAPSYSMVMRHGV